MRQAVNFWLYLFGIISGSLAALSALSRLLDIGLSGFVLDLVKFYRGVLYPVWLGLGAIFGISIPPTVADLLSIYLIVALVVLRIIILLVGVGGLVKTLLPFPEGPPFPRMRLVSVLGYNFIRHDNAEALLRRGAWIRSVSDFIFLWLGLTIVLPITFLHLWRNKWCYNAFGVIAATPFLAEPDLVAFNFRSMFLKQFFGIIIAGILFYLFG